MCNYIKYMMKFIIVIAIALIISVTIILSRESEPSVDKVIIGSASDDSPSKGNNNIPEEWKLYTSDDIGFSMYYDPSLTIQEDTKTDVRFYKQGPSQRGQTEMYDGMIVTVRKVDVVGNTQAYINNQIEQYKDIGSITEPLHDSKLNGISTKEYGASSLGDAKIIFVPNDNQTLLEVSYMAPDPTNAGFQKTVDLMLSTFKLK